MRRYALILTVAMALLPATSHASASPEAVAVLDVESAWYKAVAAGDTATLGKILDDDFVHVNYRGAVEYRADMMAKIKKGLPFALSPSEQTVNFVGGVAIVCGIETVSQDGTVLVRLRYTDTYRKAGATWREVWAQETPIAK
jgi:hypothetical protein